MTLFEKSPGPTLVLNFISSIIMLSFCVFIRNISHSPHCEGILSNYKSINFTTTC